ncbi:WPP domain-interacting tail-anchored protein 2 [Raphanus sativus]|nr:WPP domain-interacting tail-anchored protein 2 [Raphanus sativus]
MGKEGLVAETSQRSWELRLWEKNPQDDFANKWCRRLVSKVKSLVGDYGGYKRCARFRWRLEIKCLCGTWFERRSCLISQLSVLSVPSSRMEETSQEDHGEEALSSRSEEEEQAREGMFKILTKLEIDSAYTSEKLLNLHVLLMHLLAWDNDLEGMGTTLGSSAASFEKALTFDLLCGILESELKDVDEVLDELEAQIVDTSYKLSACKEVSYNVMEGKLAESAESLKQSRGQVSEITLQLAQLRRTLHYIRNGTSENEESVEYSGNNQDLRQKYALRPSDLRHKNALRMLEKSLSRELELEKKLMEFQQNEEQLKLKLHYTEEVSSRMEEASEFIWGRFLEAENSSEVFMGVSKELVGRLQIIQFSQNGAAQREAELKAKLEDITAQLEARDLEVKQLEGTIQENQEIVSEVVTLREHVKLTEQKLKDTEVELKSVNASKQEVLVHLAEMENANESVKESLFEAESRAESGETKIKELNAANLELTEELSFLKDADDKKTKKVNSLEKQLRELEFQLQNSKVSSEAFQEQQNMLYSAIWDMETLIEDLKSKASKAESRTETVEEQCIVLSTTNSALNKEVTSLRQRAKSLEASLDLINKEKEKYAQEIATRNKLLMDMVMQLSSERERIKEQLYSLAKENEKLRVNQCSEGSKYQRNGTYDGDKELPTTTDGGGIGGLAESLQAGG